MVRSFLAAALRENRGMHEAAYLLAAFALGSQLLALVRDRLLAGTFGASHTLDVYYAAFRIPDFLFATVASLLSLYALLPVLSKLAAQNESSMASFLRQMLLIFFAAMGCISLVVFIFAPALIPFAAPGIANPDLLLLTRILLLQPIFLGASNIIASLTQLRHRFFLYAVSPLLYNFGIILGIVVLYPRIGVQGLAWGVVFGALMHLCVQVPFFLRQPAAPGLPTRAVFGELAAVLALSVPRTLALAATQISLLVLVALASLLSAGSISVFMFAYNLQAVPLVIIGVSYSVAAFPTLARLHAEGQHAEFVRYIETALRHILFWSIPATIFVIVLRAQLVRVILGAGEFSWNSTRLVAAALALFVVSLAAQSIILLIARAYYAAGNTKKPLYFGIVNVMVSVLSAVAFVLLFHWSPFARGFIEALLRVMDVPGTTVLMLALGLTLGSIMQFGVGFYYFARDFDISGRVLGSLGFQSFSASVIGACVTYLVLSLTGAAGSVNTAVGLVAQGALAGGLGIAATVGVLFLLGNRELAEVVLALRRRFVDAPEVAIEATDITS